MTEYENRKIIPYYLGFHHMRALEHAPGHVFYEASPAVYYRPQGLLVWGVDATTLIHSFRIGHVECLRASTDPIPAAIFSSPLSFEDFLKLSKERPHSTVLMGELTEPPRQFYWLRAGERSLSPIDRLVVEVSGPMDTLVTWGIASVE